MRASRGLFLDMGQKTGDPWYVRPAPNCEASWLEGLAPWRSALDYTGRFAVSLAAPA